MDGNDDLVATNVELCETLGEQFVSAYSVPIPNVELSSSKNDLDSQGIPVLIEVRASTKDLKTSFKEISSNSSGGPEGVPAAALKKKKHSDQLLSH